MHQKRRHITCDRQADISMYIHQRLVANVANANANPNANANSNPITLTLTLSRPTGMLYHAIAHTAQSICVPRGLVGASYVGVARRRNRHGAPATIASFHRHVDRILLYLTSTVTELTAAYCLAASTTI